MRTVFIDFVNTLIEFDKQKFFNEASSILKISEERIKQMWKQNWKPLYTEYSSGKKWTTGEFWKMVLEKSGMESGNAMKLHKAFMDSQSPIEKSIELLKLLKAKYKVVLLTNEITEWTDETLKAFDMKKYFDEIIISQNVGCRKPDKRIFDFALSKSNEMPENCLFISDEPMELGFAKHLGMETVFVENKNLAPIINRFR